MVIIDNKDDNDSKNNSDIKKDTLTTDNNKTERYEIDKRELTFPIEGLKNARIVKEGADISEGKLNDVLINPTATDKEQQTKTPEQIKADELDRLIMMIPI